jgi:hypothetical protein
MIINATTLDSLRVFLWAVSAYNDGTVDNIRFVIDTRDPYVDI